MSTSYYFTPRKEKFPEFKSIDPFMSDKKLREVLTIKIGWRDGDGPLIFIRYNEIESVKELKSYYEKSKKNMVIVDEYGNELTWDEFERETMDWNMHSLNMEDIKEVKDKYKSVTVDEDGYIFVRLF